MRRAVERLLMEHVVRNQILSCTGHIKELETLFDSLNETDRDIALQVAWSFHGTMYSWGGDDPTAFDCSGYIVEILKSVGLLSRGSDYTAHDLFEKFKARTINQPYAGCLAFWFTEDGKARHVEICINDRFTIGASGGGSKTISIADAIAQNAFVKVRPISNGSRAFADPFRPEVPV